MYQLQTFCLWVTGAENVLEGHRTKFGKWSRPRQAWEPWSNWPNEPLLAEAARPVCYHHCPRTLSGINSNCLCHRLMIQSLSEGGLQIVGGSWILDSLKMMNFCCSVILLYKYSIIYLTSYPLVNIQVVVFKFSLAKSIVAKKIMCVFVYFCICGINSW